LPEDLETAWNRVRDELRREVTDATFHLWLEPLRAVGLEDGRLVIQAPDHIRSWVKERFARPLRLAAERALEAAAGIEIVDASWRPGASRREVGPAPAPSERLNPKYTFEQFVISDGNRFAHAAALAVAELPGQAYNPLFVYGRPGLGKTHLLHAIGNYVRRYGGGLGVRYVTVEEFTSEFVEAVRTRSSHDFKDRFRGADVLLVDDVQFLAEKTRTQEEFFHTFNALYESGRQLVLTCDRPPSDLAELEARVRERFECGLVADLAPPDLEARIAILRKRARHDGIEVSAETLREIAGRVDSSVRALEGALIRVVAYASMRGDQPGRDLAAGVLDRLYPRRSRRAADPQAIQRVVAGEFGVTLDLLAAYDRRPGAVRARQWGMYLTRELTDESLPSIGRAFGGRDHSTVIHACRRVEEQLRADPDAQERLMRLRAMVQRDA
jgi:chromosomal replication initiator protein